MNCTKCAGESRVIDSRGATFHGDNVVRRRRFCLGCGHRWTTYELITGKRMQLELHYLEDELREIIRRCEKALSAMEGMTDDEGTERRKPAVQAKPLGIDAHTGSA